jgi:hypothetical protein
MFSMRRRCPLRDEDVQLFEEALIEIVDNFSESWLDSNSGHPLQTLWHRKDILASMELYILGKSIQGIKNTSPDQLRQNLKVLKGDDIGNISGAVWEIVLAAAFNKPLKQKSRLLGPRMETFDIEVMAINGSASHISVKNFGQSNKARDFLDNFEAIEKVIKINAVKHTQIMITRKGNYPSPQEWAALKRSVFMHVKEKNYCRYPIDGWEILMRPLTYDLIKERIGLDQATLYAKEASYTFFMALPFYKNEIRNITSKLDDACLDLIKKGGKESSTSKNILFIHLPQYISLDFYSEWCGRFFSHNPEAPIAFIALAQPVYAMDNNEHFLAIDHRVISRPNRLDTCNLEIEIPLLKPVNEVKYLLDGDVEIPRHYYMMQSGNIQVDYGDFTHGAKTKLMFYNGIRFSAIIADPYGEKIEFSGNFPPTTNLVLL